MKYEIPYQKCTIFHKKLGYEIEILVPAKAKHRTAAIRALSGIYYEAFSHYSFKKILDYKGNRSVIHAGTFYGDMLHTYSKSASMVYAFEPVLENYVLAKLNAENLGLGNVTLSNSALSDTNGIAKIQTEEENGTFSGGGSSLTEDTILRTETVTTYKIDSLPIDDLCLLQLDVEGHERQALLGGLSSIKKHKPIILIEDNRNNCSEILRELDYDLSFKKAGLNYWALEDDRKFVNSLLE